MLPPTPPTEALTTQQCEATFGGRDHWAFDMTHREGTHDELWEVVGEVIHGDIYDLARITRPGDVWVDAGGHVGLFSIAAMMAGADVAIVYDMDATMAWCAEANVRSFLMQQLVRDYRRRLRTVALVSEIRGPDELVAASMQIKEVWDASPRRSCLKLDVQGAEQVILALDGAGKLAEAYDVMVLEWHYPEDLPWLMEHLERGGWKVDTVKQHSDVLLNTSTYIVWAHSG